MGESEEGFEWEERYGRALPIIYNAFNRGGVVGCNVQAQGVIAAADAKASDEVVGVGTLVVGHDGRGEDEGVEHAEESDDQGLGVHCRYRGDWTRLVFIW